MYAIAEINFGVKEIEQQDHKVSSVKGRCRELGT